MSKAVKKVGNIAKTVNVPYQATKGVINLARGKGPLSGLQQDAASTGIKLLGAGGGEGDVQPPSNLNELLSATYAQSKLDKAAIEEMGSDEEARARASNTKALDMRRARRAELASLLAKQADESFQLSKPELAEEANSAGILSSTGFGDRLAKAKLELARERENALAQNALTDVDADIAGEESALTLGRGYRDSGMSRAFSLQDFAREGQLAKEIGANAAPATKESGKAGLLSGGTAGASAGAPFGPMGAGIGGLTGAILGAGAKKGK